jgi:hypothetical protein
LKCKAEANIRTVVDSLSVVDKRVKFEMASPNQRTAILRSRTNAFCFFFWKKKNATKPFAFCEAEQTLFASFSGKRRVLLNHSHSAKQNKRFLLLFLEKEEPQATNSSQNTGSCNKLRVRGTIEARGARLAWGCAVCGLFRSFLFEDLLFDDRFFVELGHDGGVELSAAHGALT